jgi:hypothetical protein
LGVNEGLSSRQETTLCKYQDIVHQIIVDLINEGHGEWFG